MNDNYTFSLMSEAAPALQQGNYRIEATSIISIGAVRKEEYKTIAEKNVRITSDESNMGDQLIQSVFPPRGGRGDFSTSLPFIVFKDRSLPWRKRLDFKGTDSDKNPWMVILAFPTNENCGEILEVSERKLKIPVQTFKNYMPGYSDLKYLAHVRKVEVNNKVTGENGMTDTFSCILGNRFIGAGQNRAYLISLEGLQNYFEEGTNGDGKAFSSCLDEVDEVEAECLYDWSFFCEEEKFGIEQFISQATVDTLRPPEESASEDPVCLGYVPVRHYLINGDRTVSWYRGPFCPVRVEQENFRWSDFAAEQVSYDEHSGMLDISYSCAWQLGRQLALSDNKYASALIRYYKDQHNKAYSEVKLQNEFAGDELGSLLDCMAGMLRKGDGENTNYHFVKKEEQDAPADEFWENNINSRKSLRRSRIADEMPGEDYPELIKDKLQRWAAFYDVPFEWLFPNEASALEESIRLFAVDDNWLKAFLNGALSLGRGSRILKPEDYLKPDELIRESIHLNRSPRIGLLNGMRGIRDDSEITKLREEYKNRNEDLPCFCMTGILIHSELVADNPGLEVHLYNKICKEGDVIDPDSELEIIRMERLKPSMMLVLAAGEIKCVMLDIPSESMRYGCLTADGSYIELRNPADGKYYDSQKQAKLFYHDTEENDTDQAFGKGTLAFERISREIAEKLEKDPASITSAEVSLELTTSEYRGVINFDE
ncbi:MAG: hypothetical protein J5898_00920 [Lachnospiraceae bacterium]|nr:hypothetical protein [Lachnospiraceae bacterium]